MRSLFSKKSAPSVGRQRVLRDDPQQASIFAYRSQRSDYSASTGRKQGREQIQQKPHEQLYNLLGRSGLILVSIVAIVCLVEILSLSTSPRMVIVGSSASRYALRSVDTYQFAATKALKSSLLNHNKITVNTDGVSSSLEQQFPELANVTITLPLLGHRPVIYIQSTEPAFILHTTSGSFVVGDSGRAMLLASQLPDQATAALPVITDQTGNKASLGQAVLAVSQVSFIKTVLAELSARQVPVSGLQLPNSSNELDVYPTGQAYFVKFNMQQADPRQQVGSYLAVRATLTKQNITPAKYVDVRVEGRAYYL